MTVDFDPYKRLGVPRDATGKQLRQAHHELARKYHPDVNHSPGAAARFAQVQEAYDLLSDAQARARYDKTHDEAGRTRLVQSPGGGFHPDGEGTPPAYRAPRKKTAAELSVYPRAVNFGVITPGRRWADAAVTVTWTGEPPGVITRDSGGLPGWWTITGSDWPSQSVVYHVRAAGLRSAGDGPRHAQFTVHVDGTDLTVDLTAEFHGAFPDYLPPGFKPLPKPYTPPAEKPPGPPSPWSVAARVLLAILMIAAIGFFLLHGHGPHH
jgi:hypothetical protein